MTLTETARLLPYHVRLAAISLRRNPAMTLLMYASLALGAGVWSVTVTQYTRFNGSAESLSPTLHHVELARRSELSAAIDGQQAGRLRLAPLAVELRALASPDEVRRFVTDEVPARHAISMRGEVVLEAASPGGGGAAAVRMARFANADFFALFAREFAAGGPWTAAEDDGGGGGKVQLHRVGRRVVRLNFSHWDGIGAKRHADSRYERLQLCAQLLRLRLRRGRCLRLQFF